MLRKFFFFDKFLHKNVSESREMKEAIIKISVKQLYMTLRKLPLSETTSRINLSCKAYIQNLWMNPNPTTASYCPALKKNAKTPTHKCAVLLINWFRFQFLLLNH